MFIVFPASVAWIKICLVDVSEIEADKPEIVLIATADAEANWAPEADVFCASKVRPANEISVKEPDNSEEAAVKSCVLNPKVWESPSEVWI